MNQTLSHSPEMNQNNGDVYENLQVELLNGSSEDTKIFKGLSSFTTVRSFRAVVAARLGTSPTNVQLMMFGEYMDDSSTLGDSGVDEGTIITRVMSPSPIQQQAPVSETLDASRLPDRYSGRRLNTLFIKDMSNVSNAIRDVPIQMTAGDFIQYAANQMGIKAAEMRLLYGSKQLTHGSKVLLMDYDINENSTFYLVDRLPGGCVDGENEV